MLITLKEKFRRETRGDVLIVDPPWDIRNDRRNGVRASSRWPHEYPPGRLQSNFPFFMGYACSFLEQNGINAHLTTFAPPRMPHPLFLKEIVRRKYRIVLVETSTPTIQSDLKFCEDLKAGMDCLVGLVGGFASANAERCMAHPAVDAVLKGEYEKNALAFARTEASGIYDYCITEDIDTLPFPERRDILFGEILYKDGCLGAKPEKQVQLWGSRGCPYRCSFCMHPPVMYNHAPYRPRSAENIAAELDHLIRINGGNDFHVYFDDDTFNIGESRMLEIAEVFRERDIQYAAMCRADTLKRFETLQHMQRCGFRGMKIGVESGCQELVDACNKNLNLDDVRKCRAWCRELGIFIHMTFTFGLEGETHQTMQRTKAFIEELAPDSIQVSGCSPVPGTEYHETLRRRGLIGEHTKLDGRSILHVGA